jgi:positive regulator of sigma E activity
MKGRVLETAGDTVLIAGEGESPPAGCGGCAGAAWGCAAADCKLGSVPAAPLLIRVKNTGGPELKPGEAVDLRRGGLVFQAVCALLPPTAGFVLGYVLAGHRLAGPVAGLVLMFLTAFAVYCFRRRHQARVFFRIRGRRSGHVREHLKI